jgi:hypothetical protein
MTSAKGAGVEPKIGQRLDDALAVQLGDYHLDNLHEASSLGGFIGLCPRGRILDARFNQFARTGIL